MRIVAVGLLSAVLAIDLSHELPRLRRVIRLKEPSVTAVPDEDPRFRHQLP
jgi:hypothetical protein